MATSPSHQVGEWIGDFFENSIINYLKPIIMKKDFILIIDILVQLETIAKKLLA